MTPERAEEIAVGAWRIVSAAYAWNTQDLTAPLQRAILIACAEQREIDAKICEEHYTIEGIAQRCAAAIRGQT